MSFLDSLKQFFKKPYLRVGINPADKKFVEKRWQHVEELMQLGRPSNFRQAVIEADKLLGYVLEKMGYGGGLGEKLKAAKDRFSKATYNEIWEAHKMRNRLVHEVSAELLSWQAKKATSQLERGLRELGVL